LYGSQILLPTEQGPHLFQQASSLPASPPQSLEGAQSDGLHRALHRQAGSLQVRLALTPRAHHCSSRLMGSKETAFLMRITHLLTTPRMVEQATPTSLTALSTYSTRQSFLAFPILVHLLQIRPAMHAFIRRSIMTGRLPDIVAQELFAIIQRWRLRPVTHLPR